MAGWVQHGPAGNSSQNPINQCPAWFNHQIWGFHHDCLSGNLRWVESKSPCYLYHVIRYHLGMIQYHVCLAEVKHVDRASLHEHSGEDSLNHSSKLSTVAPEDCELEMENMSTNSCS